MWYRTIIMRNHVTKKSKNTGFQTHAYGDSCLASTLPTSHHVLYKTSLTPPSVRLERHRADSIRHNRRQFFIPLPTQTCFSTPLSRF